MGRPVLAKQPNRGDVLKSKAFFSFLARIELAFSTNIRYLQ
jgi:hypothetical protein